MELTFQHMYKVKWRQRLWGKGRREEEWGCRVMGGCVPSP